MSYKFDCLISILNKLDNEENVTARSLMEELEIGERTAYRYIQTLQIAGFPIAYDRKKGSYAFGEGYGLKKLDLTMEETLAFALAKKMLGNFGAGMEKSLTAIEKKLAPKKADLPKHIVLTSEPLPAEMESHLGSIHQAITNYLRIEIVYDALHSDEVSRREIDPYYLFFKEGLWYMRGYCHQSEALRTFALDRIVSLKVLDKHFLPKRVNPEEELSSSFGTWLDGEPTEVVLIFDKEVKAQVLRKKWHPKQKEKELKDGRLEMRFTVRGLGGIKKWIYQWIPHVQIVSPRELVDSLREALQEALKKTPNKKGGKDGNS